MWENGAPVPPSFSAGEKSNTGKSRREGETLWWGQFLLCAVIVGVVYAAVTLQWPIVQTLRTSFAQAMRPEQTAFLSEERLFSKFTEQTAAVFGTAVEGIWEHLHQPATAETAARPAHSKQPAVPSGAREETYLPDFPLVFPLADSSVTRTSGYGWRTAPMGGSGSEFHLGNDLAAAMGTAVLAAADGVVRCAGVHDSYGNYLRILHENGDETLYAHLQYLFVHTGQVVSAGECLGTVGQTGNSTGPHLHFELLHRGLRYDPSEALQAAS